MNNIIWKNIYLDGKLSDYDISNNGQVLNRTTGKLRTPCISNSYLHITLYMKGSSYTFSIHQLVAIYFVNNPDPLNRNTVDHKDGNKLNNWYWNLEWVTPKENKRRAILMGLDNPHHGNQPKGIESGVSNHTEQEAHDVCKMLEQGFNMMEISNKLHVDKDFVRYIKRGGWNHISSQYRIPETKSIQIMTVEELAGIRYLNDFNISNRDIASAIGLPDPDNRGRKRVCDYRNKFFKKYEKDGSSTTSTWVIFDLGGIDNKYNQHA